MAITQEQFVANYKAALEPHDKRVAAVVEAKKVAQAYMLLLGGHYECNAQNINVLSIPNDKARYFTDDELVEMTTKEN
jgi:hypothetical protein